MTGTNEQLISSRGRIFTSHRTRNTEFQSFNNPLPVVKISEAFKKLCSTSNIEINTPLQGSAPLAPGKVHPAPNGLKVVCAPEPVWAVCRRTKSLVCAVKQCRLVDPVGKQMCAYIPTELHRSPSLYITTGEEKCLVCDIACRNMFHISFSQGSIWFLC